MLLLLERIESLAKGSHIWQSLGSDNSWVEFDEDLSSHLEDIFKTGGVRTCTWIDVGGSVYYVKVDRLCMYHAESGVVVKLRRYTFFMSSLVQLLWT